MNPLDRRPELLRLVMGITDAVYRAAPPDPGSAVEACTGALLSLARADPPSLGGKMLGQVDHIVV